MADEKKPASTWAAEEKEALARAAKETALTRKHEAEARIEEYKAEKERLALVDKQRTERFYQAGDFENRVLRFSYIVAEKSVRDTIGTLTNFHRMDPGCEITLVINSPGGSVIDGMALYDHIRYLARQGHKIVTVAQGMAASMGGVLLQAGDHRIMGPEAFLLIHEVSSIVWGSTGEMEDEVELVKKMNDRILNIYAARSTLSKSSIRSRWRRKDWYCNSTEALKYGFVDEVSGMQHTKRRSTKAET